MNRSFFRNSKFSKSYVAFLFLGLVGMYSCMSDIRPDRMKNPDYDVQKNTVKGQKILKEVALLNGLENWNKLSTYEVELEDQYYGIFKYIGHPYPSSHVRLTLRYAPSSYDGQLEFNDGKSKGELWGLQEWNTYLKEVDQPIELKKDKDIKFVIPTYQYFIEMPFRLLEGSVIRYAGMEKFNNIEYDLIFISWLKDAPQPKIDQYLAWVNKDTKNIDLVEFTIRDKSRFIKGVVLYNDYQIIDSIRFPKNISVKTNKNNSGWMHKMKLHSITTNSFSPKMLRPLDYIQKADKN